MNLGDEGGCFFFVGSRLRRRFWLPVCSCFFYILFFMYKRGFAFFFLFSFFSWGGFGHGLIFDSLCFFFLVRRSPSALVKRTGSERTVAFREMHGCEC